MSNLYAALTLLSVHMFHLAITQTTNPPCSCAGYGGCNFNTRFSPDGTKENVALGKPASASSLWSLNHLACTAVNGNIGNTHTQEARSPNCHHSGATDVNSWWEVDLVQSYTINNVTIFVRDTQPGRMQDTKIAVDNQECYLIRDVPSYPHTKREIQCSKPLRGRKLRLFKVNPRNMYINVCEVQVWVCKAGRYGPTCTEKCSEHCKIGSTCENYNGTCLQGCEPQWFGSKCETNDCKFCVGCNNKTGVCNDCLPNRFGASCNNTCSSKCSQVVGRKICDIRNGTCLHGCSSGWYGNTCDTLCPTICVGGCKQLDGTCNDCPPNRVGNMCENNCSSHCSISGNLTVCDRTYGTCIYGCLPGWYSSDCSKPCLKNCDKCDQLSGKCKGCSPGWYGLDCSDACSPNCTTACEQLSGICKGCALGWYGLQCKNACSENCLDGCEQDSGICTGRWDETGCLKEQFGIECEYNCSSNCSRDLDTRVCDFQDGTCLQGCEKGFYGDYCDKLCSVTCAPSTDNKSKCDFKSGKCLNFCSMGFYGEYCKEVCGHCESAPCHHLSGICSDGCAAGYAGNQCKVRILPTTWEVIIVLASFGLFTLGVPIAIRFKQWYILRKKRIRYAK